MNDQIIGSLLNVLGGEIKNFFNGRGGQSNQSINSLSSEAKKTMAIFPVVVSKGISSKTIYLIAKALERKYALQLKTVIDSHFMSNRDSITDYLSNFHTNLLNTGSVHGGELPANYSPAQFIPESFDSLGYTNVPLMEMLEFRPIEESHKRIINESSPSRAASRQMNPPVARDTNKNLFTDSDVKKCNELTPTYIPITTTFVVNGSGNNNGGMITKNFNIGVKTFIHAVTSQDMILNLNKAVDRGNGLFNFIKATTGEISFFKDFLLMINQTKSDHLDKSSGIWNKLRERRMQSSLRNIFRYSTGLIPNTTLILSMSEAEYLKNEYNADILSPKIALGVIKEYFLASIVVVDESTELFHLIDDSTPLYEQLTFNALSKEMDKSSDLTTVLNLMKTRGGY